MAQATSRIGRYRIATSFGRFNATN